jgi:hypothetical protein
MGSRLTTFANPLFYVWCMSSPYLFSAKSIATNQVPISTVTVKSFLVVTLTVMSDFYIEVTMKSDFNKSRRVHA